MERLTPQDLMNLWPDDFGWPMDIGALAILDGSALFDPDGPFRIAAVRDAVERRLPLVPRFRQVLLTPGSGLGRPLWVDAQSFDLSRHVGVRQLPAPASEAQLLLAVEELRGRRLERSRPLWEMWFLPGLPHDRVGMFVKLHHTVADGVSGVATLGALLGERAGAPPVPAAEWAPAPLPSRLDLFRDNLRRRITSGQRVLAALAHPVDTADRAGRVWPAARVGLVGPRAPRTTLNRPIGAHRRFAVVRTRLDLLKEIAHPEGATVNDVLLTVVAGGLRDLLAGRGERVDGVVLRAFVPVSLHHERPGQARGNQDAVMVAPLPIGQPDPSRRLQLIAAETTELKKTANFPALNAFPSGVVQRAAWRLARHQRYMNVPITNVPGPTTPLHLAGAPVLELFPVTPISVNLTLGVGALSYAGQFTITAVADRDACPDVDVFTAGVLDSLQALARLP